MSWLWEPHTIYAWFGSIVCQFLVYVGVATPVWKRIADYLNPRKPGGEGDSTTSVARTWMPHETLSKFLSKGQTDIRR